MADSETLAIETFDFEIIQKAYPSVLGTTLIPGNPHLTALEFFKRQPNFQYYWFIEYDVRYTGNWKDLFDGFADNPSDLLASHIRHQEEEPRWIFWKTLQLPPGETLSGPMIRAFCPVQRLSARALRLLAVSVQEGWSGHFECLVPTLLAEKGYALSDFGGDGRYVPKGFRNRYYTSYSWRDGNLLHFGSMRFRPNHDVIQPSGRALLYHPVKPQPHASPMNVRMRRALYAVKNLVINPFGFRRSLRRLRFP
jgi:hypothetical protein